MKKLLLTGASLLAALGSPVLSQTPPPPPPPPLAKAKPVDKSLLTEAEFEAKILESLKKPVAWRQYTPPGIDISIDLPREPVRQVESFYDESIGNSKLEMFVSVSEGSTFLVGRMALPYSISDPKLIREMFEEVAKEMGAESALAVKYSTEYTFIGHPGVEMRSEPPAAGFLAPLFRGFTTGRSIYMLYVLPHHSPPADEPLPKTELATFQKEIDRFFSSVILKQDRSKVAESKPPASLASPIFSSTFVDGTFRSDYFKFSFKLPPHWLRVSEEDVEGVQQVGLDYVAANSELPLPKPITRRNLATFVSEPLGNDGIAMLAINVGPRSSSFEDALKLAEVTIGLIEKLPTYEIRKQPTLTQLGGVKMYTMETTIKMSLGDQYQVMYFLQRRDRLLAVTLTYHDEADRRAGLAALDKIVFEAL